MFVSAWLVISDTGITSTGTIDSVTVRGCARLPTTTSSPRLIAWSSSAKSWFAVWPLATETVCV